MRKVLNVGGNDKEIPIPKQYDGWVHVLLDIDPRANPDIVCDARELTSLPAATYDSVYCSHNLEHYYHHEVPKVLAGMVHVLKSDGFAFIRVPDLGQVMQAVVSNQLDINDVLYESEVGPITVRDVIYGYAVEIERSGNHFFGHKTGFTPKSLRSVLHSAGFRWMFTSVGDLDVAIVAFVDKPNVYAEALLGLPKSI
jgi:hypothetical protein